MREQDGGLAVCGAVTLLLADGGCSFKLNFCAQFGGVDLENDVAACKRGAVSGLLLTQALPGGQDEYNPVTARASGGCAQTTLHCTKKQAVPGTSV